MPSKAQVEAAELLARLVTIAWRPPAREPVAELAAAPWLQAEEAMPKVFALCLRAGWAAESEPAQPQAGWARSAIAWRPAAVRGMAHSSAQGAARGRHLAGPEPLVEQAPALPREEPAAWDVVEEPAARHAVVPRQAVAWAGAEGLRPEAVRQEARDAPAVLRGAQPLALPSAVQPLVLPLAAPWVCRRDQALPWPAPQPAALFARAIACLQIALP